MTPEQEIEVRKRLVTILRDIPEIGRIIAAPTPFNDAAEFWSTDESLVAELETLHAIDSAVIRGAWLYWKSFQDLDDGDENAPTVLYTYHLYLFAQSDFERVEEMTITDPIFKLMLKVYNTFIAGILKVKSEFQGRRVIPGLDPEVFTTRVSRSMTAIEEVQNNVPCIYIPGVTGYSFVGGLPIEIRARNC